MLYAIFAMLVIILDQWVKYWVAATIPGNSLGESFIPGILSLVNLHNDGAAFGIFSGSGARIYFIVLTGVFTVAVILMLATRFINTPLARWSIVMVTAGGLSNCIDRIIYGYVQDMFKVELFDFAVFNVADIFITVFSLLFALAIIFEKDPEPEYDDGAPFEEDSERLEKPSLLKRSKKEERSEADFEELFAKPEEKKAGKKVALEMPFKKKTSSHAAEPKETKEAPQKPVKRKYDEEYEQYKAKRAAQQQAAQPAAKKAPAYDPADPFAEWERANARVDAQEKNLSAVKAGMPSAPAAPVARTRPAEAPAAPAPAEVYEPAVKPAAAKSSVSDDDFDLDSILAEFK